LCTVNPRLRPAGPGPLLGTPEPLSRVRSSRAQADTPTRDRRSAHPMGQTRSRTEPRPLTDRRRRFVDEYLKDLNATLAYQRAGYTGSSQVAAVEGHRLLGEPRIADAIALAQFQRAKRTHVEADAVLHELVLLYSSDITHYVITDTGEVTLA